MKRIALHSFYKIREYLRQPAYLVSTMLFPSMFFWFFAAPNATTPERAQMLIGSFASFAVLGVVLFQFGVGIANDRAVPWSSYLRTLPVKAFEILSAQLLAGFFFAVFAVCGVLLTAHLVSNVQMPSDRWLPMLSTVYFGGLPFAIMGLFIGLVCSPRSAIPVANLVYLPLSFAGGLWFPPNALPVPIQKISEFLPTRMYAELVWSATFKTEVKNQNIIGLVIYLVLFTTASIYLYKKDEGERFG
jgi:ABC-2 type transport system permease protein